jgi:hypothetical protein
MAFACGSLYCAEAMPDRRDPDRIQHAIFEMVMSRVLAIVCGHEDAIDLDRLRHDPLMKLAVGRCPESGQPLASQSTISRLENAPSKTEAARLTATLLDQFGTTVKPGKLEILDIDDTFCAADGAQQLALWNAHHDERGFASMHIYHVTSGTPVVAILRAALTPKGTEVTTPAAGHSGFSPLFGGRTRTRTLDPLIKSPRRGSRRQEAACQDSARPRPKVEAEAKRKSEAEAESPEAQNPILSGTLPGHSSNQLRLSD